MATVTRDAVIFQPQLLVRRHRTGRTSGPLVLGVPVHRLPKLDLVTVRIHDPGERAVLVRFRSADDFHPTRTQLREHLAEVVDPVVDHEGRMTWAEPSARSEEHTSELQSLRQLVCRLLLEK